MISLLSVLLIACTAAGRDITFPSVAGYQSPMMALGHENIDITGAKFAGLTTFANLPYVHCLDKDGSEKYDIAILGAPFDTGVTGRPGARFGPGGIRAGSRRISPEAGWNIYSGKNLFKEWATIIDCGDAPLTVLDNTVALKQLDTAHRIISNRASNSTEYTVPRIVTLGGDHTTTLSALRSTFKHWGPVSVIHFDSHIDTWDPEVLGGGISHYAGVNHGTFLHIAHEEGLVRNTSIHAGIRAPVMNKKRDVKHDRQCGFEMVTARDLDRLTPQGVIEKLKRRTAEVGGWSTRELLTVLDGLTGLEVIGGDVVEVAPIYDNAGEPTTLAAAEVVMSLLQLMVDQPVKAE
ncbi:Arginase/deacetylase [Aureobasidium subglaciale]|nr:Arginase/deacetylase [Aureobasidium subglaciale]